MSHNPKPNGESRQTKTRPERLHAPENAAEFFKMYHRYIVDRVRHLLSARYSILNSIHNLSAEDIANDVVLKITAAFQKQSRFDTQRVTTI